MFLLTPTCQDYRRVPPQWGWSLEPHHSGQALSWLGYTPSPKCTFDVSLKNKRKKKKLANLAKTNLSKDSIFFWLQSQMIYLRNQWHERKTTFFSEQGQLETIQRHHFPSITERLRYCGAPWPKSTGKLQSVEHTANILKVYDFKWLQQNLCSPFPGNIKKKKSVP